MNYFTNPPKTDLCVHSEVDYIKDKIAIHEWNVIIFSVHDMFYINAVSVYYLFNGLISVSYQIDASVQF